MRTNKCIGPWLFDGFNYLLLSVLVIVTLYPIYYMAIISVSDGLLVSRGDVRFFPAGFNWEAYKTVLEDPAIIRSYGNTFVYTFLGTLINVGLTALCAYPLSRNKLYGKSVFTFLIILTMFFHGGIIPNYLVVNNLGLLDSMWAILLPPAINVWYMIMMRTFFSGIPNELHESAFIDGANDVHIFLRIVLPLSMPVLATMTMFYAVWHWNSFFPAMIYLNDQKLFPVQIIMRKIVVAGQMGNQSMAASGSELTVLVSAENIKYAVIIITIFPILAIYPFIQKYFVKGVMVGSLKG
ncbi:carbohydrate ABC transporter permease [Paenibacillus radicis (ex Xue et al. 2023)]|uniref:Carbohydrate ABC transporter permease n=1 Tax=Paenibacillus radicis (ex Xue et al. 2023) TaxID=2972489 RepID=A0ABT1YFJ0_9BACL|nr:carbohydrate ABC transporter permease [Paenibacillus radicis (ex Xue et al. 2023)]MCR8631692.1 carbohydrate ABC transporter permease [Paenibacillus radicis (ex Xue et al. 2023)]